MYLISACLAGINCKYSGGNNLNKRISKLVSEGNVMLVCPEVLGGLQIPRIPCEIIIDEDGNKRVINKAGQDVTKEFIEGAEKTLKIAQIADIEIAILKAKSPSCGCGLIYDGTFSGNIIKGNGLTADLLIQNGIKVYTEENFC